MKVIQKTAMCHVCVITITLALLFRFFQTEDLFFHSELQVILEGKFSLCAKVIEVVVLFQSVHQVMTKGNIEKVCHFFVIQFSVRWICM